MAVNQIESGGGMNPGQAEGVDLSALAGLAPALAATFASISGDIALVIGADGVIRSVALAEAAHQANQWVGMPFVDAVTRDTRGKIAQLLRDVDSTGVSRRREVNLPGAEGRDIPMAFAAIRLGAQGPVLAVGRDLRAIAAIQQRFVEAQQELERDYWKRRQAESRYRLLFQVATDAVLMVDAATLAIVEANGAAAELFGLSTDQLVGQSVSAGMAAGSRPAVDELLVSARSSGRAAEIRARLGGPPTAERPGLIDISATPFRAEIEGSTALLLLVRARSVSERGMAAVNPLAAYVEQTPDAVVITDSSGRVLMANPAFQSLCPAGMAEAEFKGRLLTELLGDPGHGLAGLLSEVRRNGIASQVRAPIGGVGKSAPAEVEVSAALLTESDQACIGLTLRRHAPRLHPGLPALDGLATAVDNLAAQLGRVSLPELMQGASHLAERHLLCDALQQARGHSASAADLLGITPESLAHRLQRHGLSAGRCDPPALLN